MSSSKKRRNEARAIRQARNQILQASEGASPLQSVATVSSLQVSQTYSGPIPPPDLLRKYDEVVPGAARSILDSWVRQCDHRIRLESRVVTSDILRSWAGLACGFVVALVALVGGGYLIVSGHEISGAVLSTSALAGLVGTFIYGTESRKRERLERYKSVHRKLP